jgi:hypothetical protein
VAGRAALGFIAWLDCRAIQTTGIEAELLVGRHNPTVPCACQSLAAAASHEGASAIVCAC